MTDNILNEEISNKSVNVPNLRFPEFDEEWEKAVLDELGDFTGGGTPTSSNIDYWKGTIPWISSSDIEEEHISKINISRYITKDAILNSATKLCHAPVIAIVTRVGVGKIAYSKEDICTSQDFTNITNMKCDGLFLSYFLSKILKKKAGEAQGTSIKGITSKEIKLIKLYIPSLTEQKRITSFLSLIDERISTQSKIIEELECLIKGIIDFHYRSCRRKIYSIAELGEYFNVMNLSKENLSDNGKECILYGELFTTYGCVINEVKSRTAKDSCKLTFSSSNDLLFPSSTTVDAFSLISPSAILKEGVILGGDMFGIHIGEDFNNEYLSYLFNYIYKNELAKYAKGSTIVHLHYNEIKNAKIEIPSLEEQKKSVKVLRLLQEKILIEKGLLHTFQK